MLQSIRHGVLAGGLAGCLLVGLLFLDQGPSDQLVLVAQALGLNGQGASRWIGALLILALGALIGGFFGALPRQAAHSRFQLLLWGGAAGILWWAVLFMALGTLVERIPLNLYTLLLYLLLCLVYGMVLGSVYASVQKRGGTRQRA